MSIMRIQMSSGGNASFWKTALLFTSLFFFAHSGAGAKISDKGKNPGTSSASSQGGSLPQMVGFNLAGLDFGSQNDGTYQHNAVVPPKSQITHFTQQGVNVVRVPVAWNYLQPTADGPLNVTSVGIYEGLVKEVLSAGAYAIIDIHSYARRDGKIVGETGVTAESMAKFWLDLGKNFPDPKVMFGLANEPHDLNLKKWKDTVQTVVNTLRKGGINNVLLIPGDEYTGLKAFPKWYPILKEIKNPDGSTDNLIFEAHRYLDQDNSGTHPECSADVSEEVNAAVQMLQADNRQLIVGETGGGNNPGCAQLLKKFFQAIVKGYPSIVGGLLWSGGAFDKNYILTITVSDNPQGNEWKDQTNWEAVKEFLPSGSQKSGKNSGTGGSEGKPKTASRTNGGTCKPKRL